VKTIRRIDIQRIGSGAHSAYWRFDFEANDFLHHMIRNLMGCFVAIGQGLKDPDWMREALLARDRKAAAPTFSPDGLYFAGPVYDPRWGLPTHTPSYDWLPGHAL
jgi:tRNA pseudouridine38-40 synthase